ncbi:MAG TPA: NFACT family protein, partial [Pyrinomonadaceae bacterium]|nr:NFACT family protein [Pyrinomonadaceae bacterium]
MLNEPTLELIRGEIDRALSGRRVGRIFQLSKLEFAIDFRDGDRFLFIAVDPAAPRVYLIRRRIRDLEKASIPQLAFAQFLRKRISGARLTETAKIPGERVLVLRFDGTTEAGEPTLHRLVLQLTGRSANLFLLDPDRRILDRVRETFGDGQEIASSYRPPDRSSTARRDESEFDRSGFDSLSEALDIHFLNAAEQKEFKRICAAARAKLSAAQTKLAKLLGALRADLATHGDPERWKRSGDLLLANLADAAIIDGRALVVDYFDDSEPVVEIDAWWRTLAERFVVIDRSAVDYFWPKYSFQFCERRIINRQQRLDVNCSFREWLSLYIHHKTPLVTAGDLWHSDLSRRLVRALARR